MKAFSSAILMILLAALFFLYSSEIATLKRIVRTHQTMLETQYEILATQTEGIELLSNATEALILKMKGDY
jgi:hypothetical protein